MTRLQDLVDKLQLKVKAYKRQSEEAVSYLHKLDFVLINVYIVLSKMFCVCLSPHTLM